MDCSHLPYLLSHMFCAILVDMRKGRDNSERSDGKKSKRREAGKVAGSSPIHKKAHKTSGKGANLPENRQIITKGEGMEQIKAETRRLNYLRKTDDKSLKKFVRNLEILDKNGIGSSFADDNEEIIQFHKK